MPPYDFGALVCEVKDMEVDERYSRLITHTASSPYGVRFWAACRVASGLNRCDDALIVRALLVANLLEQLPRMT